MQERLIESHMSPILSVLIVNYNGSQFIRGCIDSVLKHCPHGTELIIVDNASKDNSVDIISAEYPSVKLILSRDNLGFVGGNNLAAANASGKYFLLLNNDTIINSPISPLLEIINDSPTIGVIGCRLVYGDGDQQETIGRELTPAVLALGWTPLSLVPVFRRTLHHRSNQYLLEYYESDWISGAFLITPNYLWQKLEGMDSSYFMYMEDVDYCKRIRQLGFKVVYSAKCTTTHFEGHGRPWIGRSALLNTIDSYHIYLKKFFGIRTLKWFNPLLSFIFCIRAFIFIIFFIFRRNKITLEKAEAYMKAASNLLSI